MFGGPPPKEPTGHQVHRTYQYLVLYLVFDRTLNLLVLGHRSYQVGPRAYPPAMDPRILLLLHSWIATMVVLLVGDAFMDVCQQNHHWLPSSFITHQQMRGQWQKWQWQQQWQWQQRQQWQWQRHIGAAAIFFMPRPCISCYSNFFVLWHCVLCCGNALRAVARKW